MKRISILAVLLSGLLAAPAWAQTAIQPGTIVGTFEASGYLHGYAVIFTVPEGKVARITDLLATNFSDVNCGYYMTIGTVQRWAYIPARASFVIPLNTGFGLTAGQTVSGSSCGPGTVFMQMRGFYFTIP